MPVRVLCVGNMYPPHHLGGYELVWRGAVAALRDAGHAVEVLTTDFRRAGVGDGEEPGVFRELPWWWRDHEFPRRSPRARLAVARAAHAALARRLAAGRPDAIAWWAMGGLPLSLLAAAREVASVAFVHDDWLLYGPRVDQWTRMLARRRQLGRAVERRTGVPTALALDAVRRWVFVSEFTRRRSLPALPPGAETAIAHSGIDAAFLGPGPQREWSWRLLYVGRIDERKGADVAVAALARLPAATLTVVGDGDDAHLRALREQVAAFPGRVELRAGVEHAALPAVYDEHDAVLFPAHWDEPWGLVPLEAMARGRPVVATGTGGSAEYLRDGDNALLVARGDAAALAAAVDRLAADAPLRARLREAGLATAREHTAERFNAAVVRELEALL